MKSVKLYTEAMPFQCHMKAWDKACKVSDLGGGSQALDTKGEMLSLLLLVDQAFNCSPLEH